MEAPPRIKSRGGLTIRALDCRCVCGKEVTLPFDAVYSGNTGSCGCMNPRSVTEWGPHLWDVTEPGCWVWNQTLTAHGYGQFGRAKKAHRESYERAHQVTLTPEEKVLHSCDNPPCVNPQHLHLGTQQDNMREMVERGRAWHSNYTHCINGHALVAGNTYARKDTGKPRCRKCMLEAQKRARKRRKST